MIITLDRPTRQVVSTRHVRSYAHNDSFYSHAKGRWLMLTKLFGQGRAQAPQMSTEEAIGLLRSRPRTAELVSDAYLGSDVRQEAARYSASVEFAEILAWCGGDVAGAHVLDIGAGTGLATHAFLKSGAARVTALEPSSSVVVGRGALALLPQQESITVLDAFAESIPLSDGSVDIVFGRQVMHHMQDLTQAVSEMRRVVRPRGHILMVREHVVDDPRQLRQFLAGHPVHRLAGGENAFSLAEYTAAFLSCGCVDVTVFGPWDTVVNAFPLATCNAELDDPGRVLLRRKLGRVGTVAGRSSAARAVVTRVVKRPRPGRLYSFHWRGRGTQG